MDQIVYNLVRNLLVVKYNFKDKFGNTSDYIHLIESWQGLDGKQKQCEYVFSIFRNKIEFKTPLKDFNFIITSEEKEENNANRVALRIFSQLNDFLKD